MTRDTAPLVITGRLMAAAPFDFAKSLGFIGEFTPTRGEQSLDAHTLTKAVYVLGQLMAFEVTAGNVANTLEYTLTSEEPISPTAQSAAEDRIRFFLSLDDDLRPFYAAAAADPAFAPVAQKLHGLRQVKFLTPFENACWAVLTQRTPIAVAQKVKRALTERYGGSLSVNGVAHWAFPDAPRLAAADPADPADLSALIHNKRKARYLAAVSQRFATVDEQWLRAGPYGEVEQWLRDIPGIGEWSAAFILIRGLGRMERGSASEPLLRAARAVYGDPMTADRFQTLAAHYGQMAGYWSYYLRSAE